LFEVDEIKEIQLYKNDNTANQIIREFFKERKYEIKQHKSLEEINFILMLHDGLIEDYNTHLFDIVQESFYGSININIRYYDETIPELT
jgi:hypothetical protein